MDPLSTDNISAERLTRLQDATKDYREFLETLTEAAFLVDIETGAIVGTNAAAEQLLGRDRDEILGMPQAELHPTDVRQQYQEEFREVVEAGGTDTYRDAVVSTGHGDRVPVTIGARVIEIDDEPLILGLFRDSSRRKRAEDEYRTLVETAPVGVFRSTSDGDLLYVNDALATMLGFPTPDAMMAEGALPRYDDPDDRDRLLETLREKSSIESFSTTLIARDGSPVHVLVSATRDGDTLAGFVLDITEKERLRTVAAQQAESIQELSSPIVQVWDGVLLAPIIGTMDTRRAQHLTERLLEHIVDTESPVAILDITGVPTVDTATAQHILDTVNAVNLLGSGVIITGINPDIAQTLVQLGIDLGDIETRTSLREGLRTALDHLGTQPLESLTED